jgi:hypothetical protein
MTQPTAHVAGGVGRIPLFDKDGEVRAWAVVDADQLPELSQYRWWLSGAGHAVRWEGPRQTRRCQMMHRQILGLPPGGNPKVVRVNDDKLDNRRRNLRLSQRWLAAALGSDPAVADLLTEHALRALARKAA